MSRKAKIGPLQEKILVKVAEEGCVFTRDLLSVHSNRGSINYAVHALADRGFVTIQYHGVKLYICITKRGLEHAGRYRAGEEA